MMEPVKRINGDGACAERGRVVPDKTKVLWRGGLLVMTICLMPVFFSWSAVIVFFVLSYLTLLLGHSIGMHRMMIHRSFSCSKPMGRVLVYFGVLVGMGGPFGIIKTHDMRDWAQRQPKCHAYFSHSKDYFWDVMWQLFCRFEFDNPPVLKIEDSLKNDPWLKFMECTWVLHSLGLAVILFYFGGVAWVVWGVGVRVLVSIIGHWSITYFCHNPGPGKWEVKAAGVQASNLPMLGFFTHGECWHNNHHAFPESAKIGLEKGQLDTAWIVIAWMEKMGWAKNVGRPRAESQREDLIELSV